VVNMAKLSAGGAALASALLLSGCLTVNPGIGPNGELPVIARPYDQGIDNVALVTSMPGIAYDPDGCQIWIMDDGAEGYSGRRLDRLTGLPVCNSQFPPGTVVRDYRVNGIPDLIPGGPYAPLTGALR